MTKYRFACVAYYGSFTFLFVLLLAGCSKTVPVPVAIKRKVPRPPVECNHHKDPIFPVLPVSKEPLPDEVSAEWGLRARQWSDYVKARRALCGVYTKRMQDWK